MDTAAWALLGDFIEFSVRDIYLISLAVSWPGIAVSIYLFRRAPEIRGWSMRLGVLLWLLVLPWGIPWIVDGITPGILGRSHAYGTLEYMVRTWGPGLVILPVLALGWRAGVRQWKEQRSEEATPAEGSTSEGGEDR